jgi:isochorismate synthase
LYKPIFKNDLHFVFDYSGELKRENGFSINEKLFFEKLKGSDNLRRKIRQEKLPLETFNSEDKTNFTNLVTKSIEKIGEGCFKKVVLSRCKIVPLNTEFDLIESVRKVSQKYPNAFITAIYLPENETVWVGASPELLVSIDEKGIFKTMALAGTQLATDVNNLKILPNNARWSQKEIEEQALVSRYIIDCFKKVRVREYIENGPKTVEAGNLLHLQTDYIVDTKAIEFTQFATVLLELLHPTSAVCGMPKEASLSFINENENYNREYYSGFLGPINIQNSSNIYVNLRTLKIFENNAFLYSGAGITEDSLPENEWNETEMKMETLLSILND